MDPNRFGGTPPTGGEGRGVLGNPPPSPPRVGRPSGCYRPSEHIEISVKCLGWNLQAVAGAVLQLAGPELDAELGLGGAELGAEVPPQKLQEKERVPRAGIDVQTGVGVGGKVDEW